MKFTSGLFYSFKMAQLKVWEKSLFRMKQGFKILLNHLKRLVIVSSSKNSHMTNQFKFSWVLRAVQRVVFKACIHSKEFRPYADTFPNLVTPGQNQSIKLQCFLLLFRKKLIFTKSIRIYLHIPWPANIAANFGRHIISSQPKYDFRPFKVQRPISPCDRHKKKI